MTDRLENYVRALGIRGGSAGIPVGNGSTEAVKS